MKHLLLRTLALAALPVSASNAQTSPQAYFAWTGFAFPVEEYAARRSQLMGRITRDSIALLISSGPGTSYGETFRAPNDFLYFTGLEIPGAVLVIDPVRRESLAFLPRRDDRFESRARPNDFPGRPLADDSTIQQQSGGLLIRPINELDAWLSRREGVGLPAAVLAPAGRLGSPLYPVAHPTPEDALVAYLAAHHSDLEVRDGRASVATVRMIKSRLEVAALRRSARVTMAGIRAAARAVRAGIDERTLEGILEAEFKRQGSQRVAFASIVKSGPNSVWPWRILASHYDRRNRTMRDGELVIFDVGAEVDYYVSDVGRTFPVSGRFTPEQRAVLTMQLEVADSIIAAIRPGVTFADLAAVAHRVIPPSARPHMQAGLHFGHHLGLSAGDPSLPDAPLEPGMVFTVEPWYYDHERKLAVFVEDVVLVTPSGAEVLTAGLPRRPAELEALMRDPD